jgi:hypothetical protein
MVSNKANPKQHRLWQIPTGTVLGALIMAVISGLLGPKAPWFVERLTAGSRELVTFTVNSVFSETPSNLDPSRWYVDQEVGFALAKPPQEWLINKTNPSVPLAGPSIGTVPFYRFSMSQLSPLSTIGKIQRDAIVTTEIRPATSTYELAFSDSSTIDAVPLKFNPAMSEDFLKRSIAIQVRMQRAVGEDFPTEVIDILEQRTAEGRERFASLQSEMEIQFETVVSANWPAPLEYSDNVTVTTFKTSLFRGDPIYEAVLRDRDLDLFTASSLVSMANPELISVNTKSASISADNRAMLLDTSVELKNFTLDGRSQDVAELRRFVLLALAKDEIFVVVWRNLVGLGATGEEADRMREVFQSFKVLRDKDS